jgi:hypothetical protein
MQAAGLQIPTTHLAYEDFVATLQLRFSMTNPTLAHQLAQFACSLNFEDLSKNVVHEVKRRLVFSQFRSSFLASSLKITLNGCSRFSEDAA